MTQGNDNAFPIAGKEYCSDEMGGNWCDVIKAGLTKREYFAAMAMQGLLANPDVKPLEQAHTIDAHRVDLVNRGYAKVAIGMADAILDELNKP